MICIESLYKKRGNRGELFLWGAAFGGLGVKYEYSKIR